MTFCFIQAVERGHAQTYGSLLNAMRGAIRSTNVNSGMGSGPITSLLEMLVMGGSLSGGLTQVWALQPCHQDIVWIWIGHFSLFRSERCEINSLLGLTLITISFDNLNLLDLFAWEGYFLDIEVWPKSILMEIVQEPQLSSATMFDINHPFYL